MTLCRSLFAMSVKIAAPLSIVDADMLEVLDWAKSRFTASKFNAYQDVHTLFKEASKAVATAELHAILEKLVLLGHIIGGQSEEWLETLMALKLVTRSVEKEGWRLAMTCLEEVNQKNKSALNHVLVNAAMMHRSRPLETCPGATALLELEAAWPVYVAEMAWLMLFDSSEARARLEVAVRFILNMHLNEDVGACTDIAGVIDALQLKTEPVAE